ncbi:MAG: FAD-binding protein [Tenericutes bacterium HGW-Tenericutes-2]|jgi:CO/xanthine dehydrogenase FAD-binding subunit|nr:MAG: FAD-binding protein [Tenericutes bacterium HGW-Tenericutes-2]
MEIKNYYKAATLQDAYQKLNEHSSNFIAGGGAWLKMSTSDHETMVDLSGLSLNLIEEKEQTIEVGALVTLRDFETNSSIQSLGKGYISTAAGQIMGVGFRNLASIGGSIIGRFPFSDIITPLLTLSIRLIFYPEGEMALEEYLKSKGKLTKILTKIVIEKENGKGYFKKVGNTVLDFSILNIAIYKGIHGFRISLGSRPGVGVLAHEAMDYLNHLNKIEDSNMDQAVELVLKHVRFGSNEAADESYRRELAKVYVKRGLKEVLS